MPELFMWDLAGERVIAESPEDASKVIEETHEKHSCEHCRKAMQFQIPQGSWTKVPEDEYIVLHTYSGGGKGLARDWVLEMGRGHFCVIEKGHALSLEIFLITQRPSMRHTSWENNLHPDLVAAEKNAALN